MIETRALRPSPLAWTAASAVTVGLAMTALVPLLSGPNGLLLLLGVLGAIGGLLVISWPCAGIAAILIVWMSNVSPALFGQRFLTIPYLVTCALMVPLGVILVRDRTVRLLEVPQMRLLLAIGAVHLISTWWSDFGQPFAAIADGDETQRRLVVFAARLLFLAFVFYFVTTPRRIEGMIWLVIGVIAAAAILSWGSVLGGQGAVRRAGSSEIGMNPNRLALLALFATAMVWSAGTWGHDRWRTAALPLLLILPATALASGSRSGLVQAATLGLLALGERRGGSLNLRLRTLAFLAAGALVVVSLVPRATLERTIRFDTSASAVGGESLQSRIAQHVSGVHIYLRNPVLGIGIGNFEPVAEELFGVDNTLHNSYLLALVEGGPILLVLYVWLFVLTWRNLRRLETEGRPDLVWVVKGLRLGLAVFLVASAFADAWLGELLYVILGLAIAVSALPSEASREEGGPAITPAPASGARP